MKNAMGPFKYLPLGHEVAKTQKNFAVSHQRAAVVRGISEAILWTNGVAWCL